MPNYLSNLPLKATGNISPAVFVSGDTSVTGSDWGCRQATASDTTLLGIIRDASDVPPNFAQSLTGQSITQYAAVAGQEVGVFSDGDICNLTLGAGGCTAFALLQPDANGNGVVATSTNWYGARALQAGNQSELVQVIVMIGYR